MNTEVVMKTLEAIYTWMETRSTVGVWISLMLAANASHASVCDDAGLSTANVICAVITLTCWRERPCIA